MKEIKFLLEKLKIETNNTSLYHEALTHKSFSNENGIDINYQRLEFLGDAILDFVVSEYLYCNFQNLTEGEMSILRSNAVKGSKIAEFALELKLDQYLRVGNNTIDFKSNSKIYADAFESLLGAIYLDKGINDVKKILEMNVFKFLRDSNGKEMKNPKTILQEFLQLESRGTIEYKTIAIGNKFKAEVFHDGTKFGAGSGNNKKEAEVQAAIDALKLFKKGGDNEIN